MMIRQAFVCATLVSLFAASSAGAATVFSASLTGDQEVPPVTSSAFGSAELMLNDDMDALSYDLTISGLDFGGFFTPDTDDNITGVHIHNGDVGTNGPVVFGMFNPTHDFDDLMVSFPSPGVVKMTGTWDAADTVGGADPLNTQLNDLLDGGLYFNVHTVGNPSGEIRGQITAIPEPSSFAFMLASVSGVALCYRRRR
jgi:hypothetical protein